MFCAYCQEGSGWLNDSTVVARVPGPVGAKFSAGNSGNIGSKGNTSQNMYTFQGFEDYCNNNQPGQLCYTASQGAGSVGLHIAFICNDNWDRTCVDNLTANYPTPNNSPAIWVNGISDPTISTGNSGSTGPEMIGRVNGQSYQELILIGDQEPTKGVSVASVRGNVTPSFLYSVIISCNFNGGAICPATGVTTPPGSGNRTSDIGISNANGGPDATIWDQFENPLPGPLANCPNSSVPGCWSDAAILDWKMTNCISGDGSCTGPGISVITTSNQFPNRLMGGIQSSAFSYSLANNGTTGTVANNLAILTGAPSTATVALTSSIEGVVGLVVAGAGTSGNASILWGGIGLCAFDAFIVTAGDYVEASTTSPGKCHDNGTIRPTVQIIGRAVTSGSASTVQSVLLELTQ